MEVVNRVQVVKKPPAPVEKKTPVRVVNTLQVQLVENPPQASRMGVLRETHPRARGQVMRQVRPSFVVLPIIFTALLGACQPPTPQAETLVFLVRHAERADDGAMTGQEDPHLSEAGFERARLLAETLRDAGIQYVYSTDFIRTKETAQPSAEMVGEEIRIYDPDDLEAFAATLAGTPGRHLVVGHSNTTPELVSALGGDPHGEIESMEYDRLYVVQVGPGNAGTLLLRFGPAWPSNPRLPNGDARFPSSASRRGKKTPAGQP